MTASGNFKIQHGTWTMDRTSEDIGPCWVGQTPTALGEHHAPFWFSGPEGALEGHICDIIDTAKERVFLSSQNLSAPTVVAAIMNALERKVRVYVFIDQRGFESMLSDATTHPLMGRALVRERLNRGMDLLLSDWHLPTKQGMILTCPMDGTMQDPQGGWGMELDGEQIDEIQRHAVHEFWSETDGREVLDPAEVTNPQGIAEAPYALRPLSNGDVLYRATAAHEGAKASVEDRLNLLSGCASASVLDLPSAAVPFHGQQLEFGEAVERLIVSSTEGAVPADGRYVNEHMSIPLALGSVSFLAGWDRAARSGWASLVLLNDTQAEAATNIHAKMIEGATWLGRSTCTIGDVLGATIVGGKRLEVRQTQEVDMGVQTLASMPATLEELQNHNPTFAVPEDDLAHACSFTWAAQPPVLNGSETPDALHASYAAAEQGFRERLDQLRTVNAPPKLPLFGRKVKALQARIDGCADLLKSAQTITDVVTLRDMIEDLSKEILGNLEDMSKAEEEAELERQKKEQKSEHDDRVLAARVKVQDAKKRLAAQNDVVKGIEKALKKAEDVEAKKLESDLSTAQRRLAGIQTEVKQHEDVASATFQFKPARTSTTGKKKQHRFLGNVEGHKLPIDVPKEDLPTVGRLYRRNEERWLAISTWDEVETAFAEAERLNAKVCAQEVLDQ